MRAAPASKNPEEPLTRNDKDNKYCTDTCSLCAAAPQTPPSLLEGSRSPEHPVAPPPIPPETLRRLPEPPNFRAKYHVQYALCVGRLYQLYLFTSMWGTFNAATRGFKKPHGMALELVYRAEHRCKSSGAPAGVFPWPPPGPGWAAKRPRIGDFRSYTPPHPEKT
jgi:hypothetical protein